MERITRHLTALGLTQYEARVYAALVSAGESKVGAIHETSGVPRSAIYGTLKRLESRGLVDRTAGTPAMYQAAPPALALRRLRSRVDRASTAALEQLTRLRRNGQPARSKSLWLAEGGGVLADRLSCRLAGAEKEIWILGHPRSIQMIQGDLDAAASRGVQVVLINGDGRNRSPRRKGGIQVGEAGLPPPELAGELIMGTVDRRAVFYGSKLGEREHFAWSEDPSFVRFALGVLGQLRQSYRQGSPGSKGTHRRRTKR